MWNEPDRKCLSSGRSFANKILNLHVLWSHFKSDEAAPAECGSTALRVEKEEDEEEWSGISFGCCFRIHYSSTRTNIATSQGTTTRKKCKQINKSNQISFASVASHPVISLLRIFLPGQCHLFRKWHTRRKCLTCHQSLSVGGVAGSLLVVVASTSQSAINDLSHSEITPRDAPDLHASCGKP